VTIAAKLAKKGGFKVEANSGIRNISNQNREQTGPRLRRRGEGDRLAARQVSDLPATFLEFFKVSDL
jgi:hypothetical protein